jgi:Flp pilus assembly pilin Flp
MVEYVLMVTGIAIALIVGILLLQGGLTENLSGSADCVSSAIGGADPDCPDGN